MNGLLVEVLLKDVPTGATKKGLVVLVTKLLLDVTKLVVKQGFT